MKIVIIGGGPAGIATALTLRKNNEVVIIEKKDRIGGKIPLTGNGRCNLSNTKIEQSCYYSNSDINCINNLFTDFDNEKYIRLLQDCGIYTTVEEDRIYPLSFRADQVRDLLEARVLESGVKVITDAEVCDVQTSKDLIVSYKTVLGDKSQKKSIICDRVVLATGTPAGFKRVKDNNSLYLAKLCGFKTSEFEAGLVPLICKEYDKELAGVRCQAKISYKEILEEGEVQFTDFGLSGIPAMQLSLIIDNDLERADCCVMVDFLPEFDETKKQVWIDNLSERNIDIYTALNGLVNKKIATHILKNTKIGENKVCNKLSESEKEKLLEGLTKARFFISEKKDLSSAQVSLGGITLEQLDDNLCRKDNKRIYPVGEILDVAGRCGGFNLFFAFASGYKVGMAINE